MIASFEYYIERNLNFGSITTKIKHTPTLTQDRLMLEPSDPPGGDDSSKAFILPTSFPATASSSSNGSSSSSSGGYSYRRVLVGAALSIILLTISHQLYSLIATSSTSVSVANFSDPRFRNTDTDSNVGSVSRAVYVRAMSPRKPGEGAIAPLTDIKDSKALQYGNF